MNEFEFEVNWSYQTESELELKEVEFIIFFN